MEDLVARLKAALADRYRIERELGSGGMATVYLAHDLKHDREVAVKVLRPELSAVLGAERFLREIRIAAKLSHPHILALYDSGEAEGFVYYVMPHVAGESLRSKLDREKQLAMDETIALTQQVAAALDYAHQAGVIHRDIKPENILLHEGEALVADFGIALAVSAAGGTRLTETGLSLGTPEYMSPEQATGERELTARSDMYSLGAVVYEMLVGEPPHTGNTVQAIIAKVVSVTPQPIQRVREAVPANVEGAVRCALSKVPADRFASGAEFTRALTDPTFTLPGVAGAAAVPLREGPWRRLAIGMVGLAGLLVLLAGVSLWGWLQPVPKPVTRMNIALPEGEELVIASGTDIALSPDGQRLVYVGASEGRPQLWLRPLDQLHATPLPGTEGAFAPFFSPDGEAVGFRSGRQLRVVSMEGAPPVTLVDSAWGSLGDWGTDGMLYFGDGRGSVSRVPATGGAPEVVTRPDTSRGELLHSRVDVLPNGKGMLFVIWQGSVESADIAVVEFGTGEVRVLVRGMDPQYAASGHVVYVRSDGALLAAPFDQDRLALTGPATPLVEGVAFKGGGAAQFALSKTGTLIYLTGGGQLLQPVWVDRDGRHAAVDPGWVGDFDTPALSPDGSRLAVALRGDADRDLWVKQLDTGPLSRLTFHEGSDDRPWWTPDGRSVLFVSERGDTRGLARDLYRRRADGVGQAEPVLVLPEPIMQGQFSPDGQWLVYRTGVRDDLDIHARRLRGDTGTVALVAEPDINELSPALSPDGKWLAYVSDESGGWELYVRPFPNVDDGRWQVSTAGGSEPVWAHSGRELFYKNASDELMSSEVQTSPTFMVGQHRILFSATDYDSYPYHPQYDVTADDQRFVMLKDVSSESSGLVLVLNWFEELKQRVGK